MQDLLYGVRRTAGEAESGQQSERDGATVGQRIAGGSLERMRERVAEVEHVPWSLVARVAEAEGRLERCAASNELRVRQLPELLSGEQPGLDDLGHPVQPLVGGQRLEQRGI